MVFFDETGKVLNNKEKVNKDNMKYVKFEILVDDLAEWFGRFYLSIGDEATLNPLEIIFNINNLNVYADKLIKNSMIKKKSRFLIGNWESNEIEFIEHTGSMGIKELVKECRMKEDLKFNIIFWSLFIVAVDEKAYNEKLSDISDIAYLIGFTEEMLEDWITALKLILEGKDFKNYSYVTAEANLFFKKDYSNQLELDDFNEEH